MSTTLVAENKVFQKALSQLSETDQAMIRQYIGVQPPCTRPEGMDELEFIIWRNWKEYHAFVNLRVAMGHIPSIGGVIG